MNQASFHQDKRLHTLDPERLERLNNLASKLSNTPDSQKMPVFLSILQEMRSDQISFSPDEQDLLFTILTEQMSDAEKKKASMIRQLSSQLNRK